MTNLVENRPGKVIRPGIDVPLSALAFTDADGNAVMVTPQTPLPMVGGGGSSNTTEATQLAVLAEVTSLDANVGATNVAAAGADGTGNYTVIGAMKRGLLNWATLLARIPALVSGRVPVDGSGVTQPVSGPLTAAQLTAAALATDAVVQAIRDRLPSAIRDGRFVTDELGSAAVARQLPAGVNSANTPLTASARRISIHARGDAIRYAIGTGAQTATATSHFIAAGERLDLAVPASANIAVIRVTNDATLEVTELGAA